MGMWVMSICIEMVIIVQTDLDHFTQFLQQVERFINRGKTYRGKNNFNLLKKMCRIGVVCAVGDQPYQLYPLRGEAVIQYTQLVKQLLEVFL
jgi:hypothetical protein